MIDAQQGGGVNYTYPNLSSRDLISEREMFHYVDGFKVLVVNINGYGSNFYKLLQLLDTLKVTPDLIVVSEVRLTKGHKESYDIPGYLGFMKLREGDSRVGGGVA